MGFEDELADIVRKQTINGEQTFDSELIDSIIETLKDEDTYGYIVYISAKDGRNSCGLLALGNAAYSEAKLAHAHRKADTLIDDLFNPTECEHDDDTN